MHGLLQFFSIVRKRPASYCVPMNSVTPETAPTAAMLRSGYELHQTPVEALQSFMTPTPQMFYVLHLGVVALQASAWTLNIGGMVRKPITLDWEALQLLPTRRIVAAHECAGSPLAPTKPVRRVGNVEWEGVPLSLLLGQAGVEPRARFVWSCGADSGMFNGVHHPFYQKDLPLEKALADGTLIATRMNGEPLSAERGGPARRVGPGDYGTNSTKWLTAIELQAERAPGHFTTVLYNDDIDAGGVTTRKPVWEIAPHSLIVSHHEGAAVPEGPQIVAGWGWAGPGVALVEVSADGGTTWIKTQLGGRVDYSWQRFSAQITLSPGPHTLISRATATDGALQPADGARNQWFFVRVTAGDITTAKGDSPT
jgi:DMSO/TMAO reductase YedYZ molybdopterin-dependent catalytic subunit